MQQLLYELNELRNKAEQIDISCLSFNSNQYLVVSRGLVKIDDIISDMVYVLKEPSNEDENKEKWEAMHNE